MTSSKKLLEIIAMNPLYLGLIPEVNRAVAEELGIEQFIPEEQILEIVKTKIMQNTHQNETGYRNYSARIIVTIAGFFELYLKKEDRLAEKQIDSNFWKAKERLKREKDSAVAGRLGRKLENIEKQLPPSFVKVGKNDLIEWIASELKIVRSQLSEVQEYTRRQSNLDIPWSDKKVWNASLKEAAGIVRNNFTQDQELPLDRRKYTYLLDASNDFFNSHTFPHFPNLDTEGLYENVKKYQVK